MPFDAHRNLAISSVAVAPDPPEIGNTLRIQPEHIQRWPAPPFNVTIWPYGTIPTPLLAEVCRVTAIVGDEFTFDRAQEGTFSRIIEVGDLIAETITAKALQDIESGTNFPLITTPGPITSGDSVTAPVGNFGTLNALHAPTHAAGGTDPVTLAQGQITGLPEALASIEGDVNTLQTDVNALEADVDTLQNIVANGPVALHAPTHSQGGTDPIDVKGLTGYPGGTTQFLRADKTFATLPTGQQPGLHAPTHAIGGSDPVVKTWQQPFTWAFVGDVTSLMSANSGYLPGMFVPLGAGQTGRIVGLRGRLHLGTSVGIILVKTGVPQTGTISMTTTAAPPTTALNIPLTAGDELYLQMTAPTGTPTNLNVTIYVEYTA